MATQLTNLEACSFTPSTLLSLFSLDGTAIGLPTTFEFYDGVANNYQPLTFNGVVYTPFPIKMEEMSINGQGQLTRPKVTVSNIHGVVSALLLNNQSLIGATLTRTRVFARFIDDVNFPRKKNPYGRPDPNAAYDPDVFFINRKVIENQQVVQWELTSPLEIDGVKLPRRQILANVCGFRYRDGSCMYASIPVADKNNKLFVGGAGTYGLTLNDRGAYNSSSTYNQGDYVYLNSNIPQLADVANFYVCIKNGVSNSSPLYDTINWVADACARTISACKIRFPYPAQLRGGFFPGVSTAPFTVSK